MTPTDIIILNFEEIRRRSIKLWSGIPTQLYNWQPDNDAMPMLEMVRHVLESEHAYHYIVINRGAKSDEYISPWENREYISVEDEIEFARPFRESFLDMVKSFSEHDLVEIEIVRPQVGQARKLSDFLLRIAYHESVHTGQMLSYLRASGIERPKVWD